MYNNSFLKQNILYHRIIIRTHSEYSGNWKIEKLLEYSMKGKKADIDMTILFQT